MDMSHSLILESRRINDESPAETIRQAEGAFGVLSGKKVALMGVAYRFNSEDTRNSPTLDLANLLIQRGSEVILHDPFVKPDDQKLSKYGLQPCYTRDIQEAIGSAEAVIFCTAHRDYAEGFKAILKAAPKLMGVFDGCNLYRKSQFQGQPHRVRRDRTGIQGPLKGFHRFRVRGFQDHGAWGGQ